MKKILYIIFFTALPTLATAQVGKSVEVTKEYAPSVAGAAKLPIRPDMSDTTALRPDIDYTITPLSMETTLATTPIRPATVTYWQFNRPKPVYVKLGAGWPGNTVADLYATTQNPGTGYLSGYINHDGRYSDIRNDFGVKANSLRMNNRAGVAAGKYLGKHILEGEVNYDNRMLRRYGSVTKEGAASHAASYNEFDVLVRLGDDFTDLSRTNFNVALRGALFGANSDFAESTTRARQTHLGVDLALARQFKSHILRVGAMYEHGDGTRALSGYGQDILSAGVRYGYEGRVADFEVGADYYYDKSAGADARSYLLPALRLNIHAAVGFMPYIEIDGTLRDNSLRTLSRLNPYVTPDMWCDKSSVDYNFRIGIRGGGAKGRLAYRIFAGGSIRENRIYWAVGNTDAYDRYLHFMPLQGRQNQFSINGELDYKPSSRFRMSVGVHGYMYDDTPVFENGSPAFRGTFEARYTAKKVSIGVRAALLSERKWSLVGYPLSLDKLKETGIYNVPFTVDLGADVDWRLTPGFALFAEVRNIANMKIYDYPYYPEYGVNFTAGVKFTF